MHQILERIYSLCLLAYNLEIFRVTHICLDLDAIGDSRVFQYL